MVEPQIFRQEYHDFKRQLSQINTNPPYISHKTKRTVNIDPPLHLLGRDKRWVDKKKFVFQPERLRNSQRSESKKKISSSIRMELPEIGIPGVRNMLNARYSIWGKLVWFAVITTCASICIYQVGVRFIYFLSYPLTAEVTNVINQSLVFPMVSLCPYNPFQRDIAVLELKERLSLKLNKPIRGMEELWREMPTEKYDLEDLWNYTKMVKPKISQRCGFGRKADECNFQFELKNEFKTFFGYCWTIGKKYNNDPIDYQGPMTGMTIKIDEPEELNMSRVKEYGNGDIDEQSIGYSVYIHDDDTSPKFDAFYRGLTVYHSVKTILSLNIKQFDFLNTSQHPCSVSKVVSDCWDNCIEERILKQVSCRLPFIEDSPVPLCNGSEDYNASYLAPRYIYLESTPENCGCPRRCEKTLYTPNSCTVKDQYFPNRTLILISFQDNMYERVREMEAFTLIAFFSDVGGTLGLFLGVCILTLGELLEVVVVLFKRCIRERRCVFSVEEP